MTAVNLELIGLSKQFGRKTVVDQLSFNVRAGEVFGLLGPNGAGKTTAIRMMVGLIRPTAGEVLIHGHSIRRDFTAAIRQVGAIVETPEFYRFLTGYQNMNHFLHLTPKVTPDRLEEIIAFLGMADYIHDRVDTYSLGMRQRLGVAQALLHHPSVLILDEPTNGLDPAGIKELREHLRVLAERERVAVVVSSHLLAEMELLCDRVAIIKQGRLLAVRDLKTPTKAWFRFESDPNAQALEVIRENFPELPVVAVKEGVAVAVDRNMAAQVNACLVRHAIPVYGIQSQTQSLEDLFMEVTGSENNGIDLQ